MSSENLVVMDNDFLYKADECKKQGDKLISVINEYKTIMEYLYCYGFVDTEIKANLMSIVEEINKYPSIIDSAVNEISNMLKAYVQEVDSNDNFKY